MRDAHQTFDVAEIPGFATLNPGYEGCRRVPAPGVRLRKKKR
jgi:hypothetical protein